MELWLCRWGIFGVSPEGQSCWSYTELESYSIGIIWCDVTSNNRKKAAAWDRLRFPSAKLAQALTACWRRSWRFTEPLSLTTGSDICSEAAIDWSLALLLLLRISRGGSNDMLSPALSHPRTPALTAKVEEGKWRSSLILILTRPRIHTTPSLEL